MPSYIIPSPLLIDQSFPRDDRELGVVSIALGELQELMLNGSVIVFLTQVIQEFVLSFEWQRPEGDALAREIYQLLNQWFLQQHSGLVVLNSIEVESYYSHPLPINCSAESGLSLFWADEIGKLLALHDQKCEKGRFFAGIACAYAFAGMEKVPYPDETTVRTFPILGPSEISDLDDAYIWDLPEDVHQWSIRFEQARKHCGVLGAVRIDQPSGGSHYKVVFHGARCWTLDPNCDPVPDRFLKQLISITGFPFNVIKFILTMGFVPSKKCRLVN